MYEISTSSHSILNSIPIYHLKHLLTGAGSDMINIMDMFVDHKSSEWYMHITHAPRNLFLIQFSHLCTYWKQKT